MSPGIVGGSYYEDRGSGGSLLCLRGDPTFNFNNQARSDRATVYGAEYEHPPKSALHNHEVPCVVCQVERWLVSICEKRTKFDRFVVRNVREAPNAE